MEVTCLYLQGVPLDRAIGIVALYTEGLAAGTRQRFRPLIRTIPAGTTKVRKLARSLLAEPTALLPGMDHLGIYSGAGTNGLGCEFSDSALVATRTGATYDILAYDALDPTLVDRFLRRWAEDDVSAACGVFAMELARSPAIYAMGASVMYMADEPPGRAPFTEFGRGGNWVRFSSKNDYGDRYVRDLYDRNYLKPGHEVAEALEPLVPSVDFLGRRMFVLDRSEQARCRRALLPRQLVMSDIE